MKISKAELRNIISEELEVILTNEEVGELFGEEVQQQLEGEDHGEGAMAVRQLSNISQMAGELADLVDDSDDLDEWVEAKITKSHDYLNTVLNHLSAEGTDPDFMPLKESPESDALFAEFEAALDDLRRAAKNLSPNHLNLLSMQAKKMADDLDSATTDEPKRPPEPPADEQGVLDLGPQVDRDTFRRMKGIATRRPNPRLKYKIGEQNK